MRPYDILMVIPDFLEMLFVYSVSGGISVPSFTSGPLQLILVCKSWKCIAESIPELWCRFRLVLKEEEGLSGIHSCSRILSRFLCLSRKRQLDVELIYPCDDTPNHMRPALRSLYAILRTQEDRWSNVTVQFPWDIISPNLRNCYIASKSLKRYHLDSNSKSCWNDGNPFLSIDLDLSNCPVLDNLTIIGRHVKDEYDANEESREIFFSCPPSLQVLELHSVYLLTDYGLTEDEKREQLGKWGAKNVWKVILVDAEVDEEIYSGLHFMFPSLTWLEIRHPHNFYLFESSLGSGDPIVLEKLQHLVLLLRKWQFLDTLEIPCLTTLDLTEGRFTKLDGIQGPKDNGNIPSECKPLDSNMLVRLIKRNNIVLRVFHLSAVSFDEQELINSLASMPRLEELRVQFQDTEVSDRLLNALSNRPQSKRDLFVSASRTYVETCFLCPVLTIFTLTAAPERSFLSVQAVADILTSRQVLLRGKKHPKNAWKELALPISAEYVSVFRGAVATTLNPTALVSGRKQ